MKDPLPLRSSGWFYGKLKKNPPFTVIGERKKGGIF